MKNLRVKIQTWFDKKDRLWRELPMDKQHEYTLYFFAAYLVLTIGVVVKVCYDVGKSNLGITINHIENPIVRKKESAISLQDSLLKIIKNKKHERR
ncbi:nitrogen regulatory IIA protein [Flavobacterium daejeonense]|uniref:nitrogen regulatory IIA protein n=1 Tax=Flavobacterium daejeonense TaxID=350893 RepID=UPI00047A97F7|nr:nitrogen regulatory IIA protein [Flavobacterium daejeonense]